MNKKIIVLGAIFLMILSFVFAGSQYSVGYKNSLSGDTAPGPYDGFICCYKAGKFILLKGIVAAYPAAEASFTAVAQALGDASGYVELDFPGECTPVESKKNTLNHGLDTAISDPLEGFINDACNAQPRPPCTGAGGNSKEGEKLRCCPTLVTCGDGTCQSDESSCPAGGGGW